MEIFVHCDSNKLMNQPLIMAFVPGIPFLPQAHASTSTKLPYFWLFALMLLKREILAKKLLGSSNSSSCF